LQLEGYFKKTVAGATPGTIYFGYIAYDANKMPLLPPLVALTVISPQLDIYYLLTGLGINFLLLQSAKVLVIQTFPLGQSLYEF